MKSNLKKPSRKNHTTLSINFTPVYPSKIPLYKNPFDFPVKASISTTISPEQEPIAITISTTDYGLAQESTFTTNSIISTTSTSYDPDHTEPSTTQDNGDPGGTITSSTPDALETTSNAFAGDCLTINETLYYNFDESISILMQALESNECDYRKSWYCYTNRNGTYRKWRKGLWKIFIYHELFKYKDPGENLEHEQENELTKRPTNNFKDDIEMFVLKNDSYNLFLKIQEYLDNIVRYAGSQDASSWSIQYFMCIPLGDWGHMSDYYNCKYRVSQLDTL